MLDFITGLDFQILYWIQEHIRTSFLDGLAVFLSEAFNGGFLWVMLCAVLVTFRKTRLSGFMILAAMGLALLIGELGMKNIFCRIRPCYVDTSVILAVKAPSSYSFPSGHTGSSFAAATALFLCNRKWGIPALVLAAVVGLSRIYLFVHFPTDVLAGALFGIACGLLAWFIFKKADIENKITKNRNNRSFQEA